MFGIGLPEFIIIAIVALLILGPEKLPEVAKGLAKTMNEIRRAGDEVKKAVIETNIAGELKDAVEKDVFSAVNSEKKSYAHSGAPTKEEREARLAEQRAKADKEDKRSDSAESSPDVKTGDAKKVD